MFQEQGYDDFFDDDDHPRVVGYRPAVPHEPAMSPERAVETKSAPNFAFNGKFFLPRGSLIYCS